MNVVAIARHGIGVAGVPPMGLAVARGIAIESIRHAEPERLALQAAGAEAELAWLARCAARYRPAPLPPGLELAISVGVRLGPHAAAAERLVARILVAEREAELGDRCGAVVRIGPERIVLDRRDGSPPTPVLSRLVGLAEAERWAREQVGRSRGAR
ncbi:MAG: hypothetical protein BGO95_11175 [Micrococcales bacterium 73-13]|nr:MAG: hypothetical protein BGO95_11175 [Micrococcales bacterium 73-13]